jgi:hypothetical protein
MSCAEILHLISDAALACATIVLSAFTLWLVLETKSAAKKQLGVKTWLFFVTRWESGEMKRARSKLAREIQLAGTPPSIDDTVLDFFEQVGTTYRLECIEKELAYSSFSWDVTHWWTALESYIKGMQTELRDSSTYAEFETMAKGMKDPKPDTAEMEQYLKDEVSLVEGSSS